jgi:heat shock protein HspQ
MKFEIRKETKRNGTWYHIFKDGSFQTLYLTYEDAKKYVDDAIYDIQHPSVIETIETIEI